MESGVDFVAVDIPKANRLTIHILAAVALRRRPRFERQRRRKERRGYS